MAIERLLLKSKSSKLLFEISKIVSPVLALKSILEKLLKAPLKFVKPVLVKRLMSSIVLLLQLSVCKAIKSSIPNKLSILALETSKVINPLIFDVNNRLSNTSSCPKLINACSKLASGIFPISVERYLLGCAARNETIGQL